MKRTMKKIMSLAMAGSMIAAMGVTAFAAEGGVTDGFDYEIDLQIPTIEVALTAQPAIIMNPYGLTYTIPGTESDTGSDSIYTAVSAITSTTLAPLDVDVTLTSSAPDGVSWGTSSVTASTEKEIFLQFGMQATADANVDATTQLSFTGMSVADAPTTVPSKAGLSSLKSPLITLDGSAQSQGEDAYFFVMPAAADAETPSYAQFQLKGDLAQKSETSWTAEDAITVSVAFTFNMMTDAQLVTP